MAYLTDYGQTIAAVTAGIADIIAGTTAPAEVTARMPVTARAGQSGASVNLFLYEDAPTRYRVGGEPASPGSVIGTELRYLVTAYPAHKTDPDASSQVLYGASRGAVENNPVMSVTLPSGMVRQVRLSTTSLGIVEHTALWIASDAPMRLSFVIIATVDLSTVGVRAATASIADLTAVAGPGVIAVLSGADAAAKPAAAAAIATTLGRPLLDVDLGQVVSKYIGETEHNLAGLFERADRGGAILFFDEADAVFGRRSEVRDAHDRYADANPARILDLLRRAPGPVLVSVTVAGEALLARQAIDVPFPPG
ncbi:AAA family ATPase [Lacisediminihabitans profunda]|uniref:AAA family ATPase n=1 Tax=Lacisediminihabitans profunda TaxID=2594790 RepID=A0A5C8UV79_9MICO|nr:AAA family ATPase [Lacisediminihabitans profunda]TXN31922.1 AAA family ATPase [Lacisediminihabitans profunda]